MMKRDHGQTNQLHDINWGVLDHASRAPQLHVMTMCMFKCLCVHVLCMCDCV